MTLPLPRYVIAKPLKSGRVAFYFNVPTMYRQLGCPVGNEPLGTDYATACGTDGNGGRAASLNGLFDEWDHARRTGQPVPTPAVRFGSVDWLFSEYKRSEAYRQRVSVRSQPDYERTMLLLADVMTKQGDRVGTRPVKSITPRSADKLYKIIREGGKSGRLRQGEKVIALCRKAWRVVHRLYPDQFNRDVPNPWDGVTKQARIKQTKPAVTREHVYTFARAAIEAGHPQAAAAAVICFEWLQRPENVLAGYLRWPDYRSTERPNALKIFHHKTGAVVWHPLQDADGTAFYSDAEAVLGALPRLGVPMILLPTSVGPAKPYSPFQMARLVRSLRNKIPGIPATFTLDACRHGGMTELEEAELTTGQGRALSGHRTTRAYEGYAKNTMDRALAATRKRHAHRLANIAGTSIQNEATDDHSERKSDDDAAIA
jgi:hypothetical protein